MNLLESLGATQVDLSELSDLLLRFYGHASYPSDRQVTFGRDHDACALQLIFSKRGALTGLTRGPDLRDGDLDAIRQLIADELLAPGPTLVARIIGFSAFPTTGYFRWGDDFQIVPVPSEAPKPDQFIAEHPFIFEAKISGPLQMLVTMKRGSKRLRKLELALTPLMALGFHFQSASGHKNWVYGSTEHGVGPSQYRQAGYWYEGFSGMSNDFTPLDGLEPMPARPFQDFYTGNYITVGDVHHISDSLEIALHQLSMLPELAWEKYERAAFWYQNARDSWKRSRSASYNAFVCAIEALMPPGMDERCGTCNQRTGKGPTARFREFLDEYVPPHPSDARTRSEFYRVRSLLAHGSIVLEDDLNTFSMSVRGADEQTRLRDLSCLVRIAIYNWLMHQPYVAAPSAAGTNQ